MEAKRRNTLIVFLIVILLSIGVNAIIFLNMDEKESPSYSPRHDYPWYDSVDREGPFRIGYDIHEMKLDISEKGFGFLTIGPFSDGKVPFSGVNATFLNYTVITDKNGTAIFNVTCPIESGTYDVVIELYGKPCILKIDLDVTRH